MAKTYDLKKVVCTVNGIPISGYGETDAVGLEWAQDIITPTVTADGGYTYSRNNDRGCTVTITLMQTSQAYPLLVGILEAQHGDTLGIHPPLIVPTAFMLVDPSNGDTVASGECVILNRPAPAKGKTVGEVQFRMHLPNPRVTYGVANLIPLV